MRKGKIYCSVGITAHNEERNILRLLRAIEKQKLKNVSITEIIVISSGSTDNTDRIVLRESRYDSRIKLITQINRKGKASAVNLLVEKAKEDIVVLESADTVPLKNTIEHLVSPFFDKKIGITGSHPVPVNKTESLTGYMVWMMWTLHHEISLKDPKMGEVICFRKKFEGIPILSAVDEVNIEALIKGQGYTAKYVPKAIIKNKGPETVAEFISQRRRIYAGHMSAKKEYSYRVSTLGVTRIISLIFKKILPSKEFRKHPIRNSIFTIFTILTEMYSRWLGKRDYKRKIDHHIWKTAETTRNPV